MARLNWLYSGRSLASCRSGVGLGLRWIEKELPGLRFDVMLCNPPYLPDLGFKEILVYQTTGGTFLAREVLSRGLEFADRVFLNLSSICEGVLDTLVPRSGSLKRIGRVHRIPFRVPIACRVPGYLRRLLKRGLEEAPRGRYRYWHNISTYALSRT